jgi:hypothetical protein
MLRRLVSQSDKGDAASKVAKCLLIDVIQYIGILILEIFNKIKFSFKGKLLNSNTH